MPLSETLLPFARHILHLRPVGSTYELPSFPLVLTREQVGFDTSVMRFLLGNVMAETARALGRQLIVVNNRTARDIDEAFGTISQRGVGGLVIGPYVVNSSNGNRILALARRQRFSP